MKQFLRLLLAASIITFAASMLAVSCGKTAGGGGTTANNSGNNNSGGSGGGGSNPPVIAPELKVTLNQAALAANLVKIEANGDIKINATKLATETEPYGINPGGDLTVTYVTNALRHLDANSTNLPALFTIEVTKNSTDAAESGIVLLVGENTNTNNITLRATDNSKRAASGALTSAADFNAELYGIWKRSVPTAGANFFQLISYVRSFGNGISPDTAASGYVICATEKLTGVHDATTAANTTKLPFAKATCTLGVYNSDTSRTIQEINDAWVDTAVTIKEGEFRAMGIYTGDTGLGSLSGATGWTKGSFFDAQDNDAIKAIVAKNKYVEKTFKVTIVKSSAF